VVAHTRNTRDARAARRLNEQRPASVVCADGAPIAVDRIGVARVREEWRVVERWWTDTPVRRRYFDVVLETGENGAVFLDEPAGRWFRQRA
jgi:hypothetical protein